ncbi:flagella synthesis protein FlgN [Ectopseudomonas oleovorans]|uniref:Flagella synthesis protein FlgN n=2 Tax=Pseudomonadaceae TaxID=135621 RepID=A0A397NMV7_ECTOL|nr:MULTISPECIES: flagellar protein FlgN [Pseudomonas]QMV65322.1 flagellar export chaperone FlgN [Pseudomonas berkeleyensis]RIA36577.1 flagella synthesis protein FlgN [Pseudomonas oleovorans]WSO40800.1 flagellar protein FlgN [Pseudomonas berkeleyensis]
MHDTALLDLFTTDIGTAEQLLELIDAEFQALSERDLPRLDGLLNDKQPLLALLQQHGNERSRLLQSAGLSADRDGLSALAANSTQGEQLLARSEELSNLLQRCQEANLRNGRLVRANQASVRSVLGILRGGETPGLYDSRGSAARIAQQRPLSQA